MKSKSCHGKYIVMYISIWVIFGYMFANNGVWAQQVDAINTNDITLEGGNIFQQEIKCDVVSQKINDTQKSILSDAIIAVTESQRAMERLDKGNSKEALLSLEAAREKLDLLMARAPSLSLAPIHAAVFAQNINVTPKIVKNIVDQTHLALSRGNIQQARMLMCPLGSEVVILTTNVPLVAYSLAIKTAAQLIEMNQLDQAQLKLQAALNSLVVTSHIIPIPFIKAIEILNKIDSHIDINNEESMKNPQIENLLLDLKSRFELARTLGYESGIVYAALNKQLSELRKNIKSSEGYRAKNVINKMLKSITVLINKD